jgi:hypothetical protein
MWRGTEDGWETVTKLERGQDELVEPGEVRSEGKLDMNLVLRRPGISHSSGSCF